MSGTAWTEPEKARMAELLQAGKSLKAIAEDLGRTHQSVRKMRLKTPDMKAVAVATSVAGPSHHLTAWSTEKRQQVAGFLRAGLSALEIGEKFGVSRNAITGLVCRDPVLKKIGFKRRHGQHGRAFQSKSNVVRLPPRQKVNAAGAAKPLTPVAAPAPSTSRLRVVNDIPAMVEEWLAQHGARKFSKGESADHQSIRFFLQDRGYELSGWQGKFRISKGAGRPKVMTWRVVLEFVDEIRLSEGLEPILGRAA